MEYGLGNVDFYEVNSVNLEDICDNLSDCEVVKKKNVYYINAPCSFDIETTSFYKGSEKQAIMYLWQLDINGFCLYGREWNEFILVLKYISETFSLGKNLRLVIYVHNLAYEFQFFRKYFNWYKVFAREKRKPMQALTTNGIEFRCSLMLSGYSLAKVADNLHKFKIKKLTEDFDYNKIRTPLTKLTDKELEYAYNDIKIVEFFIREEIERNGDISKIPMTQTGYIRRKMKENCYNKDNLNEYKKFRDRIHELVIADISEYKQLKRAFAGGFTHANAFYSNMEINNVSSIDFNSSYPAVMVNEKFPMSSAHYIEKIETMQQFNELVNQYCCIFDIEFLDLESTTIYDHPISSSKAFILEGAQIDNGRVVRADKLGITITEVDYSYLVKFYSWSNIRIYNFRYYFKDYLPKQIIEVIGELYKDKTTLKGVPEKDVEYMHSKGLLNSTYGMMVTDICPDNITYDGDWGQSPYDERDIEKYNKAKQRFLYYPWGIYVTAYARRNLFTGIYEFGTDYIYSDTDSIKCVNYDKHLDYIERYNKNCINKSKQALIYHNLSIDYAAPKDNKGRIRNLGVWDYEGIYTRFKTLGSKRYLVETNGKFSLTVSGVNKKFAIPYMLTQSNNIFDIFNENLVIPKGHTGKKILTYIDDEISGKLVDYNGIEYSYKELSSIHMEDTSYNFSMSQVYLDFIKGIQTDRYGG